jgi:hypothetical protein
MHPTPSATATTGPALPSWHFGNNLLARDPNSLEPPPHNLCLTVGKDLVNISPLTSTLPAVNVVTLSHTAPSKWSTPSQRPYSPGEPWKLAQWYAWEMAQTGWHKFFFTKQRPSSIHRNIHTLPHPAAIFLHHLSVTGVPAVMHMAPWPLHQCDAAYHRGAHTSATHQFTSYLHADQHNYIKMGYWTLLPYHLLQHLPHLCLAPAGAAPQWECRPRPIMDYSFYNTNQECVLLHPQHVVVII